MMHDPPSALRACRDYEHWASEVKRLTAEIGSIACPKQEVDQPEGMDGPLVMFTEGDSCFQEAKEIRVTVSGDDWEERPLRLEEIARRVSDCSACSRLCVLIAERRARQQFGVAKRRVRSVGKKLIAAGATP